MALRLCAGASRRSGYDGSRFLVENRGAKRILADRSGQAEAVLCRVFLERDAMVPEGDDGYKGNSSLRGIFVRADCQGGA